MLRDGGEEKSSCGAHGRPPAGLAGAQRRGRGLVVRCTAEMVERV